MKKLFILLIAIVVISTLATDPVRSQDHETLNRFMKKYGAQNWRTGYQEKVEGEDRYKMIEQIGQPMPEFYFNKQLNSNVLKGKFVVLNFWATWCGGCRILSCDLDTVMFRNMTPYRDVQVIGVDANETLADKGYDAKKWWAEQNINYPSVYGKAADACCESVHGGHPTAILVDDKGIIRGRWDAWSPGVAEMISLTIWALKIIPEEGIKANLATVKSYMEKGEYCKAVYLLDMMPDLPAYAAIRYKCYMEYGSRYAVDYFAGLQAKYEVDRAKDEWRWKPVPEYISIVREIADYVYNSGSDDLNILKNGVDAIMTLVSTGNGNDPSVYEKAGVLRIRYADVYRQRGVNMLKSAVDMAKRGDRSSAEIEHLASVLKSYQK